ncbi:hypothetical protein L1787_24500 [Acuticoccus sp. M5D2P5]|uniref:hypothetical protein n=1 Tax=Acuticoccus kalidii TaxID=2910977 RepID=UPI001F1F7430|nr:hypothetical protein [Acuticoccus kalidii]MCF3936557.1 hypothetical protein [Acuticoccus kalidii]
MPVLAGVVIILGALLIGIFRGMSGGVIVAILLGGLMASSPVILDTLQRQERAATTPDATLTATAVVARGAAELAEVNNQAILDLSRIVATMRNTLQGLGPRLAAAGDDADADGSTLADRFDRSLSDIEERLDSAIASLSRANEVRARLDRDIETLDAQINDAPGSR